MKKFFLASLGLWGFTLCSQAQSAKFEDVLQCHNDFNNPGMAVRLEQSGELIYSGAIGVANMKTMKKLQVDDSFQIGSVTKTFTAAAILKLLEQNKLSLNDPLGKFIPDINPAYRNLTIHRVLSHTSGLPDYLGNPTVNRLYHRYAPLNQVIKTISQSPLVSGSGERYSYSNLGYILLGKVIEVVSEMPYEKFMHQTFFQPLNMTKTFVMTRGTELDNVKGYTSEQQVSQAFISPEERTDRPWKVDRSWIFSAGSITSTLSDLSLWQNALKSGKVISQQNVQLMMTRKQLLNNTPINYGYGIDIYPISGLASVSHQGMVPGFSTWHVYFPKHDLTATAFTNLDSKHPGPALLDMIALHLKLSPKRIEGPQALTVANELVGQYQSSALKKLTITYDKDTLYAHYDGEDKRKIIPRANNSFSYECTENYFQLRKKKGKYEIVPVLLYQGEQEALIKL